MQSKLADTDNQNRRWLGMREPQAGVITGFLFVDNGVYTAIASRR